MTVRLPAQRVNISQDTMGSLLKDIYRRINDLQDKYPGGPLVGSTAVVQSIADLPRPPRVGMRAYVRDTNTLHVVPGATPNNHLPAVGAWVDTLSLPPP